ncbi:MAG: hypothetical protein KAT69_04750 [Candidatus Aminicenantes bacterium]|nr:hypothetical protein [Candidatus Aminicenantes bacterium]
MTAKKFNIKNYTTDVPAERSIGEIEKLLALFGATAIMKEFSPDGLVDVLCFRLEKQTFKLPANIKGVKTVLFEGKKDYDREALIKSREAKAYRVAWRIIKDWIHAQLSLISSGQAHPHEIFLPYMFDGKQTLYQAYMDGKLLTQGKETKK